MLEVVQYKSRVASRLFALAKDQIAQRVPDGVAFHVSLKLDGHFSGLDVRSGRATFYNRTGKALKPPRREAEAARLLKQDITLAGELYVAKEGRARSFHVSEALADEAAHDLRFAAFDIIGADEPLDAVLQKLGALLPAQGRLHALEQRVVASRAEIIDAYVEAVENQGHEGLVLRAEGGLGFKIKPRHTLDMAILGFSEGGGDQKGLLRSILLGLMEADGAFRVIAKAGTGFSDEQRIDWLRRFRAMAAPSEYVEVSEKQTAYEMIRPELVAEISCLDFLTEDGGRPVSKMALSYSPERGWLTLDNRPAANFLAPVFLRLREDKAVTPQDVRFAQLSDLVELPRQAQVAGGGKAQVLRRAVYVKQTKGETAVRKFIAWKTNKETIGEHPAYVFLHVDFSPGRADPLKQEINIATNEAAALALFEASVAENVKKGWAEQA